MLTLLLVLCALGGSLTLDETSWVTVTRCRASCLDELVTLSPQEEVCAEHAECYMCWEMCERLLIDTLSWGPMCDKQDTYICPEGCSVACQFLSTNTERYQSPNSAYSAFPSDTRVEIISESQLLLSWDAPRYIGDGPSHALLYTLYWRDADNPDWTQFATTTTFSHGIDGPHFLYDQLEFKLVSVTSEGVVAETRPINPTQEAHTIDYEPSLPSYDSPPFYYDYGEQLVPSSDGSYWIDMSAGEPETSGEFGAEVTHSLVLVTEKTPFLSAEALPNTASPAGVTPPDSYRRSYYLLLGVCGLLVIVVLVLGAMLLWNHRQLREVVITRAASFRSRGASLRDSLSRRSSSKTVRTSREHIFIDMDGPWPCV